MDQAVVDQAEVTRTGSGQVPGRQHDHHPGTAPAPAGPFRLTADRLCVHGPRQPLLEPTSLSVRSGQVVLVAGDPGHGHTALALAIGGRLFPMEGAVTLDEVSTGQQRPADTDGAPGGPPPPGRRGAKTAAWATGRRLRRAVALVDVPGVSEPEPVLPLVSVVREELSMAGRRAGRATATRWLAHRGFGDFAGARMEAVPGAVRTQVLTELASVRPGVGILVLTAPDRHGTDPVAWIAVADSFATTGFAVVVTCAETSATLLGRLLGRTAVPLGGAGDTFDRLGEAW